MKCEGENLVFYESLVNHFVLYRGLNGRCCWGEFISFSNITTGVLFLFQVYISTEWCQIYITFLNNRVQLIEFKGGINEGQH